MGNWTEYEVLTLEPSKIPKVAGVYAIYFDGRLVYIGQSCNIANRFSEHRFRYGYSKIIRTPWCDVPDNTRITVKVKPSRRMGDWAMWEIRLIARIRPEFNTHHRKRRTA